MQASETKKQLGKSFPAVKDGKFLQTVAKRGTACSFLKDEDDDNCSLHYVLNSPTFNLKYKCDAIQFVLSLRAKKSLDTIAKQITVLTSTAHRSLEDSQFVYCLRLDQIKQQVDFDPYTLVMVSPAKAKSFSVYFTASAWTITEVQC